MADKTLFAGLTRLDPGDPFSLDGYSFQAINPFIIDRLLKVGAKTHRHNGVAGLTDPDQPPTGDLTTTGTLPADTTIVMGYTLVDADSGETILAPTMSLTTDAAMDAPDMTPDYTVDSVGGHMTAGSYLYAVTLTDPSGETPAGPSIPIDIDPGSDTNQITFTGLAEIVGATEGATGWRMYKATAVGRLTFIAAGGATLDELTDDGTLCPDCTTEPPQTSTTRVSQGMTFTVPTGGLNDQAQAVAFRIYAGIDGDFSTPSFVEQRPVSDLGVTITYESLVTDAGAPPDTNTSVGGAMKIDPDTELVDWHWKRPVQVVELLPEEGSEEGDIRVVLSGSSSWWIYLNDFWQPVSFPPAYWQAPVQTFDDLPTTANTIGDVRLVIGEGKLYYWLVNDPDPGTWEALTAAGDGSGGGGGGGDMVVNDDGFVELPTNASGFQWNNAAGEVSAWLYVNENADMETWREDLFDTDADPAVEFDPNMKTLGGYLVPNASSPTGTEYTTWQQLVDLWQYPFLPYKGTIDIESLNNNWSVLEVVIGEGNRGLQFGYDKTDAFSQQQGARWRANETDSWTVLNQAGWSNTIFTSGYPMRLYYTMEDDPANPGELHCQMIWYSITNNNVSFASAWFPLPGFKVAMAQSYREGNAFRLGLRALVSDRASFRVHRVKTEMWAIHHDMVAAMKNPYDDFTTTTIATSRPAP